MAAATFEPTDLSPVAARAALPGALADVVAAKAHPEHGGAWWCVRHALGPPGTTRALPRHARDTPLARGSERTVGIMLATDRRPQFHDRLVDHTGLRHVRSHRGGEAVQHHASRVAVAGSSRSCGEPCEDPRDVAVDDRSTFTEDDRGDRPGGVATDSGKREEGCGILRHHTRDAGRESPEPQHEGASPDGSSPGPCQRASTSSSEPSARARGHRGKRAMKRSKGSFTRSTWVC